MHMIAERGETANRRIGWSKHAIWLGPVITLIGAVSYFLYFVQFPTLRDTALLNLALVLVGLVLAGYGGCQLGRQRGRWLVKVVAATGFLASLAIASLFCFYLFVFSYQLPAATGAPAVDVSAPDFALPEQHGELVRLADFRGRKLVLVFYRGHW